jgi:uncharacterized Rossmann fold enzyme
MSCRRVITQKSQKLANMDEQAVSWSCVNRGVNCMTELLVANLGIIAKRWPMLAESLACQSTAHLGASLICGREQTIGVDGIQLSSRHDRLGEARLIIDTLPRESTGVTVYGIGMGDVPCLLTERTELQDIRVCILNLSLFALVLSYTDQSQWLAHPAIRLDASPPDLPRHPYVAITPDLHLAADENARLRDALVHESNLQFANRRHGGMAGHLAARVKSNEALLRRDPDAAALVKTHSNETCFVIGAGPTLESHYDFLRRQAALPAKDRPLFIAVDTAAKPLLTQGIWPDILVTMDANIGPEHLPLAASHDISLVYFPRLRTQVLELWQGPRYSAYSRHQVYDELAKEIPKIRLFANGSVIHPAIDLAVHLKAKEITLFGCDFCYVDDKTHAYWPQGALGPVAESARHWVLDGLGRRAPTDLNFKGYYRALEQYIAEHPQVIFYQTDRRSARLAGATMKEALS